MHLADSTSSGVTGCVWKRDRRRLGASRFPVILCSDIFMLNNLILSERLRFAGSGSSSAGICTGRLSAQKRTRGTTYSEQNGHYGVGGDGCFLKVIRHGRQTSKVKGGKLAIWQDMSSRENRMATTSENTWAN